MRYYIASLFAVCALAIPWFIYSYPDTALDIASMIEDGGRQLAAVFLSHNPKTIADIKSKYAAAPDAPQKRVRVLIVPGHEPGYGGAEFGALKERDLTVMLAQDLQGFMQGNNHYQTMLTRDASGWSPTFDAYFKKNWDDIAEWTAAYHNEMSRLISLGTMKSMSSSVEHNSAPTNVALRLYGITKWANENDIDITIHVHFNDYPGHPRGTPGKYTGFAIYVPESQYENSTTTKAIARNIYARLAKYNPVSDLPGESAGIVDEPELIAIGANNTSDAASMLIEYGYLYEPQFVNPDLRDKAIRDLAFQTYLGLQDFFGAQSVVNVAGAYDTLLIPHQWKSPIAAGQSDDIYALQTAFTIDGVYPPSAASKNDCPRTGKIGPCTIKALEQFQKKYGISNEKGIVGPKTQSILNSKFGGQNVI